MDLAPILEFDSDPNAILNPPVSTPPGWSERVVLCFFQDVIRRLSEEGRLTHVHDLSSEVGPNPVYRLEKDGRAVLVVHPGLGAPFAVAFVEELIALGGRKFIACGGAGVLAREIAAGHPLVLTGAVRDEGTSYHYLPAGRETTPDPAAVEALEAACRAAQIDYRLGKAWTTDAIYRETAARRAARMQEGCLVVEMEASAFFAVAQFRRVTFGQIVYGGDLVVPEGWDGRAWHKRQGDRRLMFELALDAVLRL